MKYHNKKAIVTEDGTIFDPIILKKFNQPIPDGLKFDSWMEAEYYLNLRELQKQGQVKEIKLQPSFTLQDRIVKNGFVYRKMVYKADFDVIYSDGSRKIIDVKGLETQAFKNKRKLFEGKYPELTLTLITWKHSQWMDLEDVKKEKREQKKREWELLKRGKVR